MRSPSKASCCRHPRLRLAQGRRDLTLFLQQQSVVSPQVGWAHDLSSVGGNLAYGPHSTPTRTPCPRPPASLPFLSSWFWHVPVLESVRCQGQRRKRASRAEEEYLRS